VWASVRVQRGDDQSAACGMLVTAAASLRPALSQKKQG
jgi:adenine C2-methylase RlmN of 23S rRNA A2503 and tRNA A37